MALHGVYNDMSHIKPERTTMWQLFKVMCTEWKSDFMINLISETIHVI